MREHLHELDRTSGCPERILRSVLLTSGVEKALQVSLRLIPCRGEGQWNACFALCGVEQRTAPLLMSKGERNREGVESLGRRSPLTTLLALSTLYGVIVAVCGVPPTEDLSPCVFVHMQTRTPTPTHTHTCAHTQLALSCRPRQARAV